jgi:hypothetical protein
MRTSSDFITAICQILGTEVFDNQIVYPRFHWDNPQEGKQVLLRIKRMQNQLRRLKRQVNFELSSVQSQFMMHRLEVGTSFISGSASLVLGRSSVGRIHTATRQDIRRAQLEAIKPYKNLKRIIDEVLHQLSDVKYQVEVSSGYRTARIQESPPFENAKQDCAGMGKESDLCPDITAESSEARYGGDLPAITEMSIPESPKMGAENFPVIRPPIGFTATRSTGFWWKITIVLAVVLAVYLLAWLLPSLLH